MAPPGEHKSTKNKSDYITQLPAKRARFTHPGPMLEFGDIDVGVGKWVTVDDKVETLKLVNHTDMNKESFLVRFLPGYTANSHGVHPYWEEIYVLEGSMYNDSTQSMVTAPSYAYRPPGMPHGPFHSQDGCTMLITCLREPNEKNSVWTLASCLATLGIAVLAVFLAPADMRAWAGDSALLALCLLAALSTVPRTARLAAPAALAAFLALCSAHALLHAPSVAG